MHGKLDDQTNLFLFHLHTLYLLPIQEVHLYGPIDLLNFHLGINYKVHKQDLSKNHLHMLLIELLDVLHRINDQVLNLFLLLLHRLHLFHQNQNKVLDHLQKDVVLRITNRKTILEHFVTSSFHLLFLLLRLQVFPKV